MQRANIAIFLLAIALIGFSPVVLAATALVRHRDDRPGSRARLASFLAVGAAVVAASVATAWVVSGRQTDGSQAGMSGMAGEQALSVPPRLAGERLTVAVGGAEAMSQIAALHGSTFEMVDAKVATYGGGKITLWVSEAMDANAAVRQRCAGASLPAARPSADPSPCPPRRTCIERRGWGSSTSSSRRVRPFGGSRRQRSSRSEP